MFDIPKLRENWQTSKPSVTQVLATALAISLIFSGYLVARPDVRAVLFSSGESPQGFLADSTNLQTDLVSTPPSVLGQPTLLPASDIDTMMAQLQDMQNNLQTTSNLLDQKSQAAGLPPSGTAENVAALWTEIDQLYQVMQPLMVQLEAASANPSTRSASELIALRTKVNTIHQRLGYLLQRVEAVKGQSGMPHSSHSSASTGQWVYPSGTGANPAVSNDVIYQQLYQTMTELQLLLQQMESQGFSP